MLSNEDYTELGVDAKTLKANGEKAVINNYFEGDFFPSYPTLGEKFLAPMFVYASLAESTISLMGRSLPTEEFVQLSFVLPRAVKDGRYLLGQESEVPRGVFIFSNGFFIAQSGYVTIIRDESRQTISGTFDMRFKIGTVYYDVRGKFFLNATGPL